MGCSSSKHHPHKSADCIAAFPQSTMHGTSEEEETSSKVSCESFDEAECLVNDVFERAVCVSHHVDNQPKKGDTRPACAVREEEQTHLRKLPLSNGRFHLLPKKRRESKWLGRSHTSASSSCARGLTDESRLVLRDNRLSNIGGLHVNVMPAGIISSHADSRIFSIRCMESDDGLRLLLSPITASSRSITASSRLGKFGTAVSCNGRLSGNSDAGFVSSRSLISQLVNDESLSLFAMEGTGDSGEAPGSPLFDPSILASFERALKDSSEESWRPVSDASTNSSSMVASSSLDASSDTGSPNWLEERGYISHESPGDSEKPSTTSKSKAESKFTEIKQDHLINFEWKCIPGCEDKVVLYFTSLRGVRKTYDNCGLVRLILKGYGVHVDERDTWMHSKFREELVHVMGTVTSVPRLFIKGRYIGGVEEVKRLHEDGVLENLLEGLPVKLDHACDACGDVRFMPCASCCGSCKLLSVDEKISRCPDCNENGLILCPSCGL